MSELNSVSAIETADALLRAYAEGKRSFTNLCLPKVRLSHTDLKGSDLSYADLSHANLSHTNLRGADLSYADLSHANLSGADLRGAMLIGTNLQHTNLHNANVEAADYDPETTHFPADFNPIAAGLKSDR